MKRLRLADIGVEATRKAKEYIRDGKTLPAIKTISKDFTPPLRFESAYDLYKRLRNEVLSEDLANSRNKSYASLPSN